MSNFNQLILQAANDPKGELSFSEISKTSEPFNLEEQISFQDDSQIKKLQSFTSHNPILPDPKKETSSIPEQIDHSKSKLALAREMKKKLATSKDKNKKSVLEDQASIKKNLKKGNFQKKSDLNSEIIQNIVENPKVEMNLSVFRKFTESKKNLFYKLRNIKLKKLKSGLSNQNKFRKQLSKTGGIREFQERTKSLSKNVNKKQSFQSFALKTINLGSRISSSKAEQKERNITESTNVDEYNQIVSQRLKRFKLKGNKVKYLENTEKKGENKINENNFLKNLDKFRSQMNETNVPINQEILPVKENKKKNTIKQLLCSNDNDIDSQDEKFEDFSEKKYRSEKKIVETKIANHFDLNKTNQIQVKTKIKEKKHPRLLKQKSSKLKNLSKNKDIFITTKKKIKQPIHSGHVLDEEFHKQITSRRKLIPLIEPKVLKTEEIGNEELEQKLQFLKTESIKKSRENNLMDSESETLKEGMSFNFTEKTILPVSNTNSMNEAIIDKNSILIMKKRMKKNPKPIPNVLKSQIYYQSSISQNYSILRKYDENKIPPNSVKNCILLLLFLLLDIIVQSWVFQKIRNVYEKVKGSIIELKNKFIRGINTIKRKILGVKEKIKEFICYLKSKKMRNDLKKIILGNLRKFICIGLLVILNEDGVQNWLLANKSLFALISNRQ